MRAVQPYCHNDRMNCGKQVQGNCRHNTRIENLLDILWAQTWSAAWISARYDKSNLTTSTNPPSAALIKAVSRVRWLAKLTSAPRSNRKCTILACPAAAAIRSALYSAWSGRSETSQLFLAPMVCCCCCCGVLLLLSNASLPTVSPNAYPRKLIDFCTLFDQKLNYVEMTFIGSFHEWCPTSTLLSDHEMVIKAFISFISSSVFIPHRPSPIHHQQQQ